MVDIVIPVYKPGIETYNLIDKLGRQTCSIGKVIIINTEKQYFDEFVKKYELILDEDRFEVHHISKQEFDHGNTRNFGVSLSKSQYFVCMTQDAEPASDDMLERLIKPLEDKKVAASYGRQMAREDSTIVEKMTRQFNYPEESVVKGSEDLERLGVKTYFCSNVCCAYNREIFDSLGGFISHTNFNEDMIYAAGAIKAGYKIAYTAEARVYHSHNYSASMQFHRNVDIGISQADHPEVFAGLSSESEGKKLVKSIIGQMLKEYHFLQIIGFIYSSGCRYLGYLIGKKYTKLPRSFVRMCAMNKEYLK